MTPTIYVQFATRSGSTYSQPLRHPPGDAEIQPSEAVMRARRMAAAKGIVVCNWLRITYQRRVIADYESCTPANLCRRGGC